MDKFPGDEVEYAGPEKFKEFKSEVRVLGGASLFQSGQASYLVFRRFSEEETQQLLFGAPEEEGPEQPS